MEFDNIIADPDLEENGVWFPYRDGSQVRVASAASNAFRREVERLMQPYSRQRAMGIMPPGKETEILCRAMSTHVVKDWEGMTRDGKPLPYSPQTAFEMLSRSTIFRDDMTAFGSDTDRFVKAAEELAEGNSATPSEPPSG